MRVTLHNGKGYAKHNDHVKGKREPKTHIDYSKTKDNLTWTCMDDIKEDESESTRRGIKEAELMFYNSFFSGTLAKQNAKYEAKGNYKRIRGMEEWSEAERHRPTECILQIGDKDTHSNAEELAEACERYVAWKQERFKDNLKIISISIHVDESTPHCHLREVWYHMDEDGLPQPGIKDAMRSMGVPLPYPDKPEGRNNYRKATIDAECREKWLDICEELGLDIEREPDKSRKQGHMGIEAYAEYSEAMEELDKRETALKAREARLKAQEAAFRRETEKFTLEKQKWQNKASDVLKRVDVLLDDSRDELELAEKLHHNFSEEEKKRVLRKYGSAEYRKESVDWCAEKKKKLDAEVADLQGSASRDDNTFIF